MTNFKNCTYIQDNKFSYTHHLDELFIIIFSTKWNFIFHYLYYELSKLYTNERKSEVN